MAWLNGNASDPHGSDTDPWFIVDGNDQPLVRFDHSAFPHILDGAPVIYTDNDGDGWAENVQAATAVARYSGRSGLDETAPDAAKEALRTIIMDALLRAYAATGSDREKELRRLRAQVDRFEFKDQIE